jgi:hypothetical protein
MRFSQQFSLLRLVPHRVRGIRVQIRKKSLDMISKQNMTRKWASCDINVMSHDCHKSVTWHHMTRVTQPVYILRTKIYFEQKFRKIISNQKYNFDQKYNFTKKNLILTKIPKNSWKFPLRLLKPQFEFWEIRAEHCVH